MTGKDVVVEDLIIIGEILSGLPFSQGTEPSVVILDGHIFSEIIRFARKEEVDLVVLGSSGASSMGLVLFGSVANTVDHKASCSVMIVRHKSAG